MCGRPGHKGSKCRETTFADGSKMQKCNRCGRSNHTDEKCKARYHVNGKKIRTNDEEEQQCNNNKASEELHYNDAEEYDDDLGNDKYDDNFGYTGVHVGYCKMNFGYHYNEEGDGAAEK